MALLHLLSVSYARHTHPATRMSRKPQGFHNRLLRFLGKACLIVLVLFILPVGCQYAKQLSKDDDDWWNLRRDSSEQAPVITTGTAVIQVYAARAARWRGNFGVHTWVAYKRTEDPSYQRVEVIGYRAYYGNNAVRTRTGNPDGYWFGNRPTLLREITGGAEVDEMITRIQNAAENYPYPRTYRVWPGPNSNTFVAWLGRSVPELNLELPPTAIGKDYLPNGSIASLTPSRRGAQVSLGGYAGLLVGVEEGVEMNVLGATVGVDFWPPAIKLPAVGRLGFDDVRRYDLTN